MFILDNGPGSHSDYEPGFCKELPYLSVFCETKGQLSLFDRMPFHGLKEILCLKYCISHGYAGFCQAKPTRRRSKRLLSPRQIELNAKGAQAVLDALK